MKTNESTNACPKCGAPVPPEAPQGLCPQCVFVQAAAPEGAPTATSQIPSLERLAVAFPQLQVLELIGRGGMGFVFKARQPHLDRFVALKLLPDSLAHDAHFAERFNREGRTLARLNHPNIVSIFDFGQAGGFYFLLMEYVDGVNLRQAMQAGRFSPSEALSIVPKICEALQFAHEEGILHRDIKPENILLDAKGRVKIADFGIAKIVGEDKPDVSLTATGAALGTPHYMAPEQFEKPATVDHRADIYSLGVVFYEMLTGELPIGRFSPPSQRTPLDPRVDDVVMRTLEKEREKRFQSAGEMGTNVEHLTEVGAGSFKGGPPKAPGAEPQRGPGGTMAINPSAVIPLVSKWSLKAVWGAVLAGISFLPMIVLLVFIAYAGASHGPLGSWVVILISASVALSLPAIAGTILGWMGLNEIRAHTGQRRGLPLAVFAALAWPDLIVLIIGLAIPLKVIARMGGHGITTLSAILMLPIAVGTVTFVIWTVYAAVRWGANQPAPERRGKLKWIFAMLMLGGLGFITLSTFVQGQRKRALQPATAVDQTEAASMATNTTPWIRFTFTAVELREVAGVRWLAIDYLDDVHGECQKSFPWETTIPGFKAETRASEFLGDSKDGAAPVRHQRVEYRMPDSSPRDQLERLRDDLEKTLKQKSFRLELGENEVPLTLFELPGVEGGSLQARIKVVPPLQAKDLGSPRKLELHIPTLTDNTYWSVGVTTQSELPVGDYLVGLLQFPDGREEELPVATTIRAGSGQTGTRVMRHLIWPLSQFESNRVREIDAGMRAALDGRLIELVPDRHLRAFQITNVHGAITEGFITLRSQSLSATGLPPVSVSIAEVPQNFGQPQNWGRFLSVKLMIFAPQGYVPYAVGLLSDGSELETATSIQGRGRAGEWSGDHCYWYFPQDFQAGDVQEIVRQLGTIKVTSPNGITILPGQRVPMFSVTNKTGTIFRGYFALPALTGTK